MYIIALQRILCIVGHKEKKEYYVLNVRCIGCLCIFPLLGGLVCTYILYICPFGPSNTWLATILTWHQARVSILTFHCRATPAILAQPRRLPPPTLVRLHPKWLRASHPLACVALAKVARVDVATASAARCTSSHAAHRQTPAPPQVGRPCRSAPRAVA